jgi:hypothetical protein
MATIRIPFVPDQIKDDLRKKAIDEKMTMQAYLIKIITEAVYEKKMQ